MDDNNSDILNKVESKFEEDEILNNDYDIYGFSPAENYFDKYLQHSAHTVQFATYCGGGPNDIWCTLPFSKSIYNTYLQNFIIGAKLSSYYSYSNLCLNSVTYLASDAFYFYQNRTGLGVTPHAPASW